MTEHLPTQTDGSRQPRTDRGISEVLSYALIFGMIVTAIGIVTVGGLGSLQDARANEQANNADRAYDVLANNMADVYSEGAPSRATEISLGDSQLFYGENTTVSVTVQETGAATPTTHPYELRPIVFRLDSGTELVYEAGAVVRKEEQGGSVLIEPPFTFAQDNVHLPLVRTTAPSVQAVGSTTVLVRAQSTNRSVLASGIDTDWLVHEIEITSVRSGVWERYFDRQPYCGPVTVTGNTVTCQVDSAFVDPNRFALTLQQIEVSLIT